MAHDLPPSEDPRDTEAYLDLPLGPREEEPAPEEAAEGAAPIGGGFAASVPTRRWPWILVLLLAAVVLLAAGVWLGRSWWGGPPSLRPSVTLLDFGERRVGTEGNPREVVLSHAGGRAVELASVALVGDSAAEYRLVADGCTGRRLVQRETCTALVAFAPGAVSAAAPGATGSRSATLEVVGTFGASPLEIPLLGTVVAPLLSLDRRQLSFAAQPTGVVSSPRTVRVTNRGGAAAEVGGAALDGSAAEDFRISADFCSRRTLKPDQRCAVEVVFQPAAEGDRRARLRVPWVGGEPLTVAIDGEAQAAALTVSPADGLEFAVTSVEGSAGPMRVTLTNPSATAVEVREIEASGPFRVANQDCAAILAGGATCTVDVIFEPSEAGEATGELRLESVAEEPLVLTLTGRAVAPELAFSEERLDFGAVPVGQTRTRDLTLENRGSGPGVVAVALSGAEAAVFNLSGDCLDLERGSDEGGKVGGALAAGAACTLAVTFRPVEAGGATARVTARVGGGGGLVLTGRGQVGRARLSASRLDFGSPAPGESVRRRLTVTNDGDAPLPLGGAAIQGSQGREFTLRDGCGDRGSLPAGGSCEVEVVFRPRVEGRRRSRLVWDSASPGLAPVELTAVVQRPRPRPRVTPASLGFGVVAVGQRSGIETVTLRNDGEGRLELGGVRLEGEGAHEYRLVAGTCDGLPFLAPGGSCTVGLRFEPGMAGDSAARLVVRHDGPGGASRVELTGSGQ